MNKLALSILTAIIIFPYINSSAAFAQNNQTDRYDRLERRENQPTQKKRKARYHRDRNQVKYQRQVTDIRDEYEKKSVMYDQINQNLQQLDAGGGTHIEYDSGF
jgi:hypothetical protein